MECATALVFVLDTSGLERTGWQRGMTPATNLDAGLLISAEHVFVSPERSALPGAGVQIEHRSSQFQKVGIAWEDPALVESRTQRVVLQ